MTAADFDYIYCQRHVSLNIISFLWEDYSWILYYIWLVFWCCSFDGTLVWSKHILCNCHIFHCYFCVLDQKSSNTCNMSLLVWLVLFVNQSKIEYYFQLLPYCPMLRQELAYNTSRFGLLLWGGYFCYLTFEFGRTKIL